MATAQAPRGHCLAQLHDRTSLVRTGFREGEPRPALHGTDVWPVVGHRRGSGPLPVASCRLRYSERPQSRWRDLKQELGAPNMQWELGACLVLGQPGQGLREENPAASIFPNCAWCRPPAPRQETGGLGRKGWGRYIQGHIQAWVRTLGRQLPSVANIPLWTLDLGLCALTWAGGEKGSVLHFGKSLPAHGRRHGFPCLCSWHCRGGHFC